MMNNSVHNMDIYVLKYRDENKESYTIKALNEKNARDLAYQDSGNLDWTHPGKTDCIKIGSVYDTEEIITKNS